MYLMYTVHHSLADCTQLAEEHSFVRKNYTLYYTYLMLLYIKKYFVQFYIKLNYMYAIIDEIIVKLLGQG